MDPQNPIVPKLKNLRPQLSEQQTQKSLKHIQISSFSSMLNYLLVDCNLQLDQIVQFVHALVLAIKKQNLGSNALGNSFRFAWVKIMVISMLKIDIQQAVEIIGLSDTELENGDISKFLTNASQISKKIDLTKLNKIASDIQNNSDYSLIKERFPLAQELKMKEKNEKIKEQLLELKQLKDSQANLKNSVIDQIINQNLIKAYQASLSQNPQSIYSKQNFQNFKNQLLQILKNLKISSYELQSQLSSAINAKDNFHSKIILIRTKLHPIYIPQLLKIVNRNCDVIKGQDIIAIFGDSGAGKTTTIQIMFGYKMARISNANELQTLVPVGGLKPQHKNFIAKASSKSVTKSISAAQLQLPEQFTHLGKIYLADTPGFHDSQGALVDVGNSLATLKVLRTASSVRFIFLLNQKNMGTRLQGLKKLTKLISQIFKKYNPKKVLYFMNRFAQNDLAQMGKRIQQLLKYGLNAVEQGDSNFVSIISHFNEMMKTASKNVKNKKKATMKQAISDYVTQMVVIDPFNPDLRQIYQKIMDEDLAVSDLQNQLVTMVTPQAKQVLCSQSFKFESIIDSFLRRQQILPAIYYLNQLKQFALLTQSTNDIAQAEAKHKKIIQNFQQQNYKRLKQFKSDLKDKIELFNVNQKTYEEAKNKMMKLMQIQECFKEQAESSKFKFKEQLNRSVEQTKQSLLNKVAQKQRSPRLISTIQLFSKYFSPNLYPETVSKIRSQIIQINKQIKKSINQQNYQILALALNAKAQISQMKIKIQQQEIDWQKLMNQKITQRNKIILDIFKNNQPTILQKKDIQYTKQTLNIYSMQIDTNKPKLLSIVKYGQLTKKMIVQFARKCLTNYKKVSQSSANDQQALNLMSMENYKKILLQLVEINQVKQDIELMIDQLEGKTAQRITKSLQDLQIQIHFGDNNEQQKLYQVYHSILRLKNLLKLISDPIKSSQVKLKMESTEQKTSEMITNFYQQHVKNLNWNVHSKQIIVRKLSQCCRIINVVLRNSMKKSLQQSSNLVFKACLTVKQNVRTNLMEILSKTKQYIINTMDGQKKESFYENIKKYIRDFQKLASSLSKLDSSQFSILSMKGEIKSTTNQFQISLTHIVEQLTSDIKQNINKFKEMIVQNQDNSQAIKEREVKSVEKKINVLKIFHQYEGFQNIFSQQAVHPQQNYQQIQWELENLQKQIMYNYQNKVINQQKYSLQPVYLQSCHNLKKLRIQFQQAEKIMKQKFLSFNVDLDDNIDKYFNKNNDFLSYEVKQRYIYYLKFGQDPKYTAKRSNLLQKLRNLIKYQQKNIQAAVRQLVISVKKVQFFNKITVFVNKIQQMFQKVQKCNEIIDNTANNLQISSQTISIIQSKLTQILTKYQRQLKNSISIHLNISSTMSVLASYVQTSFIPNQQQKSQNLQNLIQNYQQILSCFQLINLSKINQQVKNRKILFENQSVMEYYVRILTQKNSSNSSGQKQSVNASQSYEKDQSKDSSSQNKSMNYSKLSEKQSQSNSKIKKQSMIVVSEKQQRQPSIRNQVMVQAPTIKQNQNDEDISEVIRSLSQTKKQSPDESTQELSKNQDGQKSMQINLQKQKQKQKQASFKDSSIMEISVIQEKKQNSFQQKNSFEKALNQLPQQSFIKSQQVKIEQSSDSTFSTSVNKIQQKIDPNSDKKPIRTIFLLANTPTMQKSFQTFRKCLDEAVKRGTLPDRQYQYKIMFIRNYNSKIQDMFTQSQFYTDIRDIYKFCKKSTFMGGYPTLALEYAFNQINKHENIDQVIIFVNKRSNPTKQIQAKMEMISIKYWKDLKVSVISDAEQIQKMRKKGITIHSLYFEADQYFQQICKATNGVAQKIIKTQKGISDQITQFIANRLKERN